SNVGVTEPHQQNSEADGEVQEDAELKKPRCLDGASQRAGASTSSSILPRLLNLAPSYACCPCRERSRHEPRDTGELGRENELGLVTRRLEVVELPARVDPEPSE